jgi:hypothetical protein
MYIPRLLNFSILGLLEFYFAGLCMHVLIVSHLRKLCKANLYTS